MEKKVASGIMLILLVIGLLTSTLQIRTVKAGTITVPDDYPTIQAAINHAGDGDTVYVRAATYYENVVVNKTVSLIGENKSTTIIDGGGRGTVLLINGMYASVTANIKGFTIRNGDSYGIFIYYSSGNLISDNLVSNNGYGIEVEMSSGNSIINNTISNNRDDGIHIYGSAFIAGNKITANGDLGIHISAYSSGDIINNTVVSNWSGIWLSYSPRSKLRGNNLTGNLYNFGISADYLYQYINHDIDTSNTVNGKPIYYLINQKDLTIDTTTFPNAGYLGVINSTNVIVKGLKLTDNGQGVLFAFTTNSIVENVSVSNNSQGIFLAFSNNNKVFDNTVSNNFWGMNLIGDSTSNNNVYHNNFDNQDMQIRWVYGDGINTWDDGYPSGGNYWSDYGGIDLYTGANQDVPGSDGIGDTPYVIDENNRDNYPLMEPWTPIPTIMVDLDFDPDTLNLRSMGTWITAYIQPPEGYNAADINATTTLLNGTITPVLDPKYGFATNSSGYLVDYNNDGILERMVKFDRAAVESLVTSQGISNREAALILTGKLLDGTPFEGTDTVFVFQGSHRAKPMRPP